MTDKNDDDEEVDPADVGIPPLELNRQSINDRITVCEQVYFHAYEEPTYSTGASYSRECITSQQQPYIRRLNVGEDWFKLDNGWIEDPGLVYIQNLEGKAQLQNPTEEQIQEWSKKVLQVAFFGHPECYFEVLARESMKVMPRNPLMVRSVSGPLKLSMVVLPR